MINGAKLFINKIVLICWPDKINTDELWEKLIGIDSDRIERKGTEEHMLRNWTK